MSCARVRSYMVPSYITRRIKCYSYLRRLLWWKSRDTNRDCEIRVRTEQLGELGLPGCDEALSGMGGASLTNQVPGVM